MKTTLTVEVDYDPHLTDPEGLACALDRLLETTLSTPGIMDEYGNPRIGEFLVGEAVALSPGKSTVVVEISGGALQAAYSSQPPVRVVLVDYDTDGSEDEADVLEITEDDTGQSDCAYVAEYPAMPLSTLGGPLAQALQRTGVLHTDAAAEGAGDLRRWVLYDFDAQQLLTTKVYASYAEAAADGAAVHDVLVLPLTIAETAAADESEDNRPFTVYHRRYCEHCGADLTAKDAVSVQFVRDGEAEFALKSYVRQDGLLEDVAGNIAHGLHCCSLCRTCGAMLAELGGGDAVAETAPDDDCCDCERPGYFYSGVPGILARMENGKLAPGAAVQRCDLCQRYSSDDAALARLRDLGYA
jgi:hypothetical protein